MDSKTPTANLIAKYDGYFEMMSFLNGSIVRGTPNHFFEGFPRKISSFECEN